MTDEEGALATQGIDATQDEAIGERDGSPAREQSALILNNNMPVAGNLESSMSRVPEQMFGQNQDGTAQKNARGVILEETKLDGNRHQTVNNAEEPSMGAQEAAARLN